MNKIQTFENFLAINTVDIPMFHFVINILIAGFLAYVLKKIYVKYGSALSNKTKLANNFFLLTTTTMLIITIVKSSLALSLGLVGALSIVRFRAAIKEPEELSYLFLSICIGLGLGAGQRSVTIIGFLVIIIVLWLSSLKGKDVAGDSLLITVETKQNRSTLFKDIVGVLKENCVAVKLKRVDDAKEYLDATFLISINSIIAIDEVKEALRTLDSSIKVSYIDNSGIM